MAAVALAATGPASALEALDGRLQLHGYLETQTRVLARDLSPDDGYHLAQWYNILNVEVEWDAAPQGWGPFNLVSGFLRAEVRYDCVWTGGCYLLPGYRDRYGNDAERLPKRLSNARKERLIGVIDPDQFAERRNLIQIPLDERDSVYGAPAGLGLEAPNQRGLGFLWNLPGLDTLFFATAGPDRIWGTKDDPGAYAAERFLDYRFAFKRVPGNIGGNGVDVQGPWRPTDEVPAPGALRDRANPFRCPWDPDDYSPLLCDRRPNSGIDAMGELPFRPAPIHPFADPDDPATLAPLDQAQGLYLPNAGFRRLLAEDNLEFAPDQNFSQTALSLNHGGSQDPLYELKEAYVDLEMFDHHLWLRLGKQTIVWGKTELFRAQDQFNPQDLAIASLPSLEESRVALLSARGIWSFYDVGPLQDVRLELALNFDKFYPADTGRCGEPFAPRAACTRAAGFFAGSLVGSYIAGEFRYPYPWEDPQSLEGGARLEWRQDRVSYALTYFNGFEDLPHQEPVFLFERNVDPETGRPRRAGSRQRCDPEGLLSGDPDEGEESGCLGTFRTVVSEYVAEVSRQEALDLHHANQQLFTSICGATVSMYNDLDPEACGFTIWNSTELSSEDPAVPISLGFSVMLAGQPYLRFPWTTLGVHMLSSQGFLCVTGGFELCLADNPADVPTSELDKIPIVVLNSDPNDYIADPDEAFFNERYAARGSPPGIWDLLRDDPPFPLGGLGANLARFLSDEQEALLGCGRFWGTDCDVDGFDIFNGEASALFQSWPGFEGTEGGVWLTNDSSRWQPGTIGFAGGPLCTRYEGGRTFMLPGCRGELDWERYGGGPGVDGTAPNTPLFDSGGNLIFRGGHPFANIPGTDIPQPWRSEMAAVSWNLLVVFVTTSTATDDVDGNGLNDNFLGGRFDEFNPNDPYNPDRCSYVNPILCKNVKSLIGVSGAGKNVVKAGGNPRFGRRDFLWHGGAQIVLDYQRRHVLGFAMDFAHDRSGSNWNLELTWFHRMRMADLDSFDLTRKADLVNLTIGVDRPTFVRFLNRNRTIFLGAQLFLQYVVGYETSFTSDGPFNARLTVGAFTGYQQDRLLPGVQVVYDFPSHSGALLWSIGWRVTQSFLIQIGLNTFWGEVDSREAALVAPGTAGQGGRGEGAYRSYVENGLSTVRDRDELFLRLRYTF